MTRLPLTRNYVLLLFSLVSFSRKQWVTYPPYRNENTSTNLDGEGYVGTCLYYSSGSPSELCRYGKAVTIDPFQLSNRLPALRLMSFIRTDPVAIDSQKMGRCNAQWHQKVPVRCGSDMTRYLVANLGSNGLVDLESWPALDANNATATTAVVELFQDGGEVRVRCSPRWIRRDGSRPPANPLLGPVVQSTLVTQAGKPFFCFELDKHMFFFKLHICPIKTKIQPAPCTPMRPRSPLPVKPRSCTKTRVFHPGRSLSATRSRQSPLRQLTTTATCPVSSRASLKPTTRPITACPYMSSGNTSRSQTRRRRWASSSGPNLFSRFETVL